MSSQVVIIDEAPVEMTAAYAEMLEQRYLPETEPPTPEKCEHGCYIAKGDTTAKYCSGCNPDYGRIMVPAKRVPELHHRERTLDASEYLDSPVWARLEDASRMEAM